MRRPPSFLDLAELYDSHAQALFGFLLNFMRDEEDTQDVLQEVFLRIGRRPELLDGVRDRRGFLIRLSHNLAIDLMRRRTTREKTLERVRFESIPLFASSSDPDENAFRMALSEAMGELPPDQRAVVHLKLWEGLTFDAIAEVLGVSLNTAASRYRYGIDKLRHHLRPLYDEIK
ncbi:MAG: sigma-70 family RNA polymerase sigma factor [Verrucomicrobia bacterium]|nr:sigma-70 family RNA polymerase sigma factor [Verrucomicrobiota bacterium]